MQLEDEGDRVVYVDVDFSTNGENTTFINGGVNSHGRTDRQGCWWKSQRYRLCGVFFLYDVLKT